MRQTPKEWLASIVATPGMLACGLRRPDGKCAGHGDERNFPPVKIEKILGRFEQLHQPLPPGEFSPRWSTWDFEYGRLRFVPRPDQWLLVLIVSPETDAARELDQLAANFLSLRFK